MNHRNTSEFNGVQLSLINQQWIVSHNDLMSNISGLHTKKYQTDIHCIKEADVAVVTLQTTVLSLRFGTLVVAILVFWSQTWSLTLLYRLFALNGNHNLLNKHGTFKSSD